MLAILTTHPIQYQAPIWKKLAANADIPFRVYYLEDRSLAKRYDPEFGVPVRWDIDLLRGYDFELLSGTRKMTSDGFFSLVLESGFPARLRATGARVLWIQGWQVAAYWQAAFGARQAGCSLWLRGETNVRSNQAGSKQPLKHLLLRRLFDKVDQFLFIGAANRRFYLEHGVKEDRLAFAPYCVDNDWFNAAAVAASAERQRIRNEWGIPQDAFCFLYAGKFILKKRPFDLIEAARSLSGRDKKVHLLWVGTGELGTELRQRCDAVDAASPEGRLCATNSGERRRNSEATAMSEV